MHKLSALCQFYSARECSHGLINRTGIETIALGCRIHVVGTLFRLFSSLTPYRESRGPVYRPHRVRCNVLWLSASEHARRRVNAFNGG